MKALARHLLLELDGCSRETLNDVEFLKSCLKEGATAAGATIVSEAFFQFAPYGVSGVVIIAESHLSIHTWPEYGYAAVDVFTCGMTTKPEKATALIAEKLGARTSKLREIKRGMVSEAPAAYPRQKAEVA